MANPYSIIPLSFGSCAGCLHQSTGNVGVLLCSPAGLEELCLRRAWRMLATLCADADYPTLRFDYPGCGDSMGDLAGVTGIDALADAAVEAADELRLRAGVERLVVAGHGLGAAVAALAAPRIGAAAAALFAPPTSGRVHVKEFEAWGRRAAEALGYPPGPRGADAVGVFRLPEPLRASIEALDLRTLPAPPAPAVFLAARPNCAADGDMAERLSRSGAAVFRTVYDEHAAALEAPTVARPPLDLFAAFTAWLEQAAPIRGRRASGSAQAPKAQLEEEAFSETAVRFGSGGRLAGVACAPRAPRKGATLLFLNSGGDPHAGLGRSTVAQARALAKRGLASFRIDMSDLGDSAGAPSCEPPRIYDPQHVEDVLTAIDWLEANSFGPVMLVGRCSGASVGFSAAVRDPRIRHLVLINPPTLSVDLAASAEQPVNRFGYYLARAREPFRLLRRLRRGELDLQAVLAKLGQAVAALGLAAAVGDERKATVLHQALARLGGRGARLTLLFTEDDPHRLDIQAELAAEGRRLEGLGSIEVRLLERTDSAFTPASSKSALLELLASQALEAQASASATPVDRRGGRGRQESGLPGAAPQPRPSA